MKNNKRYISFDPNKGYPGGPNLHYECLICGEIISSYPSEPISCHCGNIHIDIDYGRMAVEDPGKVRLFTFEQEK